MITDLITRAGRAQLTVLYIQAGIILSSRYLVHGVRFLLRTHVVPCPRIPGHAVPFLLLMLVLPCSHIPVHGVQFLLLTLVLPACLCRVELMAFGIKAVMTLSQDFLAQKLLAIVWFIGAALLAYIYWKWVRHAAGVWPADQCRCGMHDGVESYSFKR